MFCFLLPQGLNFSIFLFFPHIIPKILDQAIFTLGEFSESPLHHLGNTITYLKGVHGVPTYYSVVFFSAILVPVNLYILRVHSKKMTLFDKLFLISLLFINLSPILYVLHVKILLAPILLWVFSNNFQPRARVYPLKTMIAIPALSLFSWFFFPYHFILFLVALVYFNLLVMKNTSTKEMEPHAFHL